MACVWLVSPFLLRFYAVPVLTDLLISLFVLLS